MEIDEVVIKSDRFETDVPAPPLDVKKIIKILQEIKGLKDAFPQVTIATRSNYQEVVVSNIKEGTKHSIQLKYEKFGWEIVDHQLPVSTTGSTNLIDCVRTYMLLLDNLQPFYLALQELDDLCIVGEPEEVTPKTNWRLVKYSKKIFIKIEFTNPICTDELSVTFHGCTSAVKEMEEIYHNRCSQFEDEDATIYQKLLQIFELPYFPADDEETIDCSICMSYRCDVTGGIPIVYCDNSRCSSSFHTSCLEKYLKIQKHVTVLSICIGECPFCKSLLSNSYATLFQTEINN